VIDLDINQLSDGDLLTCDPNELADLSAGGNVRKGGRDPKAYAELKKSIKTRGINQPVLIRLSNDGKRLELIAGYGRKNIAVEIGIQVPALFRKADDATALAMAAEENMLREDMSVLSEIGFAQQYVSLFDGNQALAASSLGWGIEKVKSRIQLTRCTKKVLDALGKRSINIAHATYLSVLSETVQNNTLLKIITEKWTADTLKSKLGKVQNTISKATFDTQECDLCPHNSDGIQADIFAESTGVQAGKCNNSTCFQKKTKNALQTVKDKLEEKVGKVLFFTETIKKRNTVHKDIVGSEQYSEGCITCTNRCAILDDRVGYGAQVTKDQCIDSECFEEVATLFKKEKAESENIKVAEPADIDSNTQIAVTNKKPNSTKAKKKKKVKSTLSNPLKIEIRSEIRGCVADSLFSNSHVVEAVLLAAINKLCGFGGDFDEDSIQKCMGLDIETMKEKQLMKVKEYIEKTDSAQKHIINTFRKIDTEQLELKKNWKPCEKLLKLYTKDGLCALAKTSGFDIHYNQSVIDSKKPKFEKLANGKKTDLIAALLTTEYTWEDFVPAEFLTIASTN